MNKQTINSSKEKETSFIIISILTVIIIIGSWFLTLYLLKDLPSDERGTFGDMFGSVNALFSGLAFAGIVLTILLQRKELSLQRQELKDTREELKRSAIAQENSEKSLHRQAENLKISAKLAALNTLINHYTFEMKNHVAFANDNSYSDLFRKKMECIAKIEAILTAKELGDEL